MSGDDDPFASGGKTVIRPNPGGAFGNVPGHAGGHAGPFEGGEDQKTRIGGLPPGGQVAPGGNISHGGSPFTDSQHAGLPQSDTAAWMQGGAKETFFPERREQPVVAPAQKIPLHVALGVDSDLDIPASNPVTSAAAPLLILLGRLRLNVVEMEAVPLMAHVKDEIIKFENRLRNSPVDPHDIQVAKYALCGTADDIVQNLPGTDRGIWLQYSMLAQFFNVRTSGIGFFDELNKVLANPLARIDLLELMHACLSLGFEGQYRTAQGGDATLQRVRRDVYQTLRHARPRNDDDISVRWQAMAIAMRNAARGIPSWVAASIAGILLVGVFLFFRFLLTGQGEALADDMISLHPSGELRLARVEHVAYVPPEVPETTQLERIREALAAEIEANALDVIGINEFIIIEVNNLILFNSGSAEVKPEFSALAAQIARSLNPEPGEIYVVGHTDSVKPRATSRFKSNYDLSVERARAVEKIIVQNLENPERVQVSGKGADEPIASNDTREGRAKNRRVEISIPREETLGQQQ